jgi:alcohol dehydrogenase YqhD (iron-dependent ADH family)
MRDFVFYNPTRIIFGKKATDKIGETVASAGIRRALLIYGKGSAKASGVYDRVRASLAQAGVDVTDLSGVQPNPVVSKVREGIALCRERDLEAVIPVGGGSVYDTAKAVAAGVRYEGDIWELYGDRIPVKGALPIFGILTTSATGSEMNRGSIITNEATRQKWGLHSDFIYPTVSIIDPELQATLPRSQTVWGGIDTIVHVLEVYFDGVRNVDVMSEYSEGIIRTVMKHLPRVMADAADYDSRAELAWAATLALNESTKCCRTGGDWSTHTIEHSLSAIYDIVHAAGLAVIMPAWMEHVRGEYPEIFARFAEKIFGVVAGSSPKGQEQAGLAGIAQLRAYFTSLGAPVTLRDLNIPEADLERIADNVMETKGGAPIGMMKKLVREDVLSILRRAF